MDEFEIMELKTDELIEIYDLIETYLQKIDKDIKSAEVSKDEK